MGKLVVSLDGVVIREVNLLKERTTLGRRPHNDVVIDNLAVSGEHAALVALGNDVFLEDLGSTNGTYVNGRAVKRHLLVHNDAIEIGKYKIRYQGDEETPDFEQTMILRRPLPSSASALAGAAQRAGLPTGFGPLSQGAANGNASGAAAAALSASVKVLNGAAAGREVVLTKVVTTVGKPGVQIAAITRRPSGYVLTHVEGQTRPMLNGAPLQADSTALHHGDVIELAGAQMQFSLAT